MVNHEFEIVISDVWWRLRLHWKFDAHWCVRFAMDIAIVEEHYEGIGIILRDVHY